MKYLMMAAAFSAAFSFPVGAQQQQCGPYEPFIKALAAKFGEQRILYGLMPSGDMMELWANPATRSWTAITVSPSKLTCVLRAGEGLERNVVPVKRGHET